jgi:RNA polymerase sigma-70 factor (ECF subfamily)
MADQRKPRTDEDLIAAFQQGDRDAFSLLVGRYKHPLVNFVYRFVGDYDQADDVVQETFIRLYQKADAYKPVAKFSTWLYTIAANLARTALRSRSRHGMFSLHRKRTGEGEGEREVEIRDDRYPADAMAEAALRQKIIQRALNELPEQYREVVILYDIQELSYEEICSITGMNMGTLKSRLNRGRTRLQELLKELAHE